MEELKTKLLIFVIIIAGVVTHQPVPVASLAAHVERMHLNENCGFSEEYKVLYLF